MKVSITGDPICDHHFYRGLRDTPDSLEPRGLLTGQVGGGAILLHELVKTTLDRSTHCETKLGIILDHTALPAHYHAYCLWEPQLSNLLEKEDANKHTVWRSTEPPLG